MKGPERHLIAHRDIDSASCAEFSLEVLAVCREAAAAREELQELPMFPQDFQADWSTPFRPRNAPKADLM